MNCNHWWQRPVLIAGLLVCGASLGVHQTHAAPSANLDQTRNGKFDAPENPVGIDVNGNAGFQNAHYLEGHGLPYRCVMSDLPPNTTITITLGFDIRHSSRNALDYLTGFQLLDPHTQFGHLCEVVDPTVGLSVPTPFTEWPIPLPNAAIPANSFDKLPTQSLRNSSRTNMSLWGGTLKNIQYVNDSASWNSKLADAQAQIQIDVTFTTGTGSTAILAWAGHIASRADWGFDANGVPNSAGGIDGSPYHMALITWSLGNIGQQDRSLKANAVIIPPTCDVTGDSKCVGQTATLTVTPHTQVGGFGDPYTFQWSKTLNADGSLGTIISTSQALSIPNVQLADAGTYYAKVFDKAGVSSLGCSGQLTLSNPTVTTALTPVTECPGKTVSFSTTASGTPKADGTFSFAWTKGGAPVVSGGRITISCAATTCTLTIDNLAQADAGNYCVTATGFCNGDKKCADLTVNTPTVTTALLPVTECPTNTVSFSTSASGTPKADGTFSFAWTKDGSPVVTDARVTISCTASACTLTISDLQSTDAGNYCVNVTGLCNSDKKCADLKVNVPTVTKAPDPATACADANASATFSTTASGTPQAGGIFTFVWRKAGATIPSDGTKYVIISGATTSSLTINSLVVSDAATYTVEATGLCNPDAKPVTLTVNKVTVALAGAEACPATSGGSSAQIKATTTTSSGHKDLSYEWTITMPDGSSEKCFDNEPPPAGISFIENTTAGTETLVIDTKLYKGGLVPGSCSVSVKAYDPVTTKNCCIGQSPSAALLVVGPKIACGADCGLGGPVVLRHPLDGDSLGGAAIVDNASVPLDTFPSGTDITYEAFDQFASLSLGPGQVTTTQVQVPVCNQSDVELVNVKITFYGNQTPSEILVGPDFTTPFLGTLAAHEVVLLRSTVQVQCGPVPIKVSGEANINTGGGVGTCVAESSCETSVECHEVFCRTTGGGRQDPGATTLLQVKSGNALVPDTSVKFTTHGGQMRGRQTCPLSVLPGGSPDICGQWQHVRHANNGRLQSFHTAGIFDSLRCACLACNGTEVLPDGTVCNPGDRVCGPEPRRANANAIAVTGVGKMALRPGNKDTDVVFRIYIEDRGEPGGSPFGHPEDPPDVYCIQIWIVNPSASVGLGLRASISCLLGKDLPAGIQVPDISDCGDLSRGNHQLHPVKNLNCP